MRYLPEPPADHTRIDRTGILLVNLGTPDAPTASAVRRYLREFLSDPRVVELPRVAWLPILHGIILNTRPTKSAAKYRKIWSADGSPLRVFTARQAQLLRGYLGQQVKSPFAVEYAMRYGQPSIDAILGKLKAAGCTRILVVPLYPQYAASTTASALDRVFSVLARTRNQPAIRAVRSFHEDPGYIGALAESVREYWRANGRPDHLLMSFHGLPAYTLARGDPYHCECHATARHLAQALGLGAKTWSLAFQSRFGRAQWLKPYTVAALEGYARSGVRRVDVICPGFVSDCLETLEELGIEGRERFLKAGGKEYHLIPCLNDRPAWIHALAAIVRGNLQGWVAEQWDPAVAKDVATKRLARATALGADR
jgi:protoporphyrin/coproporphyrin ferrochelatase